MSLDRRTFLKGSAAASALWMAACQPKGFASTQWHAPKGPTDLYVPMSPYLLPDERQFVEAAVDRLIPEDELGPGALKAGVADFIDYQLGGPFGRAARWYMEGPWRDGTESQGYQLRFTPAELYRHCIPHVNEYCRQNYQGAIFAELSEQNQIAVLETLEQGKVPLEIFDPGAFFIILLQNAREGFFADPMYGGNRDFAGWRLAGFPGARYNYSPFITEYGEPFRYPPVGILGRQGIPLKEVM